MGESGHQLGSELECLCMHTWQGGSSEWGRCEVKQRGWPAQSVAGNQTDLQPPHLLSALPAEPLAGDMIHELPEYPDPTPLFGLSAPATTGGQGQERL